MSMLWNKIWEYSFLHHLLHGFLTFKDLKRFHACTRQSRLSVNRTWYIQHLHQYGPTLIERRLQSMLHADVWNQSRKDMRESGAIITGSFPLQCLLDITWTESDIDIFISIEQYIAERRQDGGRMFIKPIPAYNTAGTDSGNFITPLESHLFHTHCLYEWNSQQYAPFTNGFFVRSMIHDPK